MTGTAVLITLFIMYLFVNSNNNPRIRRKYSTPEHEIITKHGWVLMRGTSPNEQHVVYTKNEHVLYKSYKGGEHWRFEHEKRIGITPYRIFDQPLISEDMDYMESIIKWSRSRPFDINSTFTSK